jgi:hypothetical protein
MIGWTHERSGEREDQTPNLGGLLQGLINAVLGAVTISAGAMVIVGAIFAPEVSEWSRAGAGAVGVVTVVCGGLMARREP